MPAHPLHNVPCPPKHKHFQIVWHNHLVFLMSSRVQETSVLLVQLFNCFGYIVREAILRPGSHYGENHDDGDGNVYDDGKKRSELVTHKTFLSS